MARTIIAVPQMFTDGITETGATTREIKLHMQIVFDNDGTRETEWHYYGTDVPVPPPAGTVVEHPAVSLPADFINMSAANSAILYSCALETIRYNLEL